MRRLRFVPMLGLALAAGWPLSTLVAQESARPAVPDDGFGFHAALGFTSIGMDYGDVMDGGIPAEGGIWYQTGGFRGAVNIQVASYDVVPPFESQSISQVELALSALWRFRRHHAFQPFVGARVGAVRFRPEGALFDPNPPPPDQPPGENPAPERTGIIGGLSAGAEYWFTRHLGLQVSAVYRLFSTEALDIPLLGVTGVEKGGAFDLRLGVEWAI